MKYKHEHRGYIALITAILISVSLLTLVIAVSLEGYFSRFSVLESELKEVSAYLAESCFNTAVLELAQDEDYNEARTVKVSDQECSIVSITSSGSFSERRIIEVQGVYKESYTNLEIEIEMDSLPEVDIFAWEEVGSFD